VPVANELLLFKFMALPAFRVLIVAVGTDPLPSNWTSIQPSCVMINTPFCGLGNINGLVSMTVCMAGKMTFCGAEAPANVVKIAFSNEISTLE